MSPLSKIVLLLLPFALAGCSGKSRPEGLPDLVDTQIKITQDGQPLSGAFVRLVPEDSKNPWSCGGASDSAGIAVIRVNGEFDGAPVGEYKVVVSKTEMDGAKGGGTDLSKLDGPSAKGPAVYDLVDPKLSMPSKTTLKISVTKDKSVHDLDVGPAVRQKQNVP